MAAVSSNALFLYRCLTESKTKIDWSVVGSTLGLKTGTASMRWQRLKARIDTSGGAAGSIPASSVIDETTLFLYQCIIHSSCKLDFDAIGKVTGLKTGTAGMRYRRLQEKIKKHHGEITAALSVTKERPVTLKSTQKSSTPRKRRAKTPKADSDGDVTGDEDGTPKRIKVEQREVVDTPTERQTMGKVLNLTEPQDDCSSSGTSMADTNTSSSHQASAFTFSIDYEMENGDEDALDSLADVQAGRRPATTIQGSRQNQMSVRNKAAAQKPAYIARSGLKMPSKLHDPVRQNLMEMAGSTAEETALDKSMAETSFYTTSMVSPQRRNIERAMPPLVADYDEVRGDLSQLKSGARLPTYNGRGTSPEVEIKAEAAIITGPTSARFQHSLNTHGSDLLQADMDRASLTPEDSVAMVGLMANPASDQPLPVEQKSEKIHLA